MIQIGMGAPGGFQKTSPTSEDIHQVFADPANYGGQIDDVGIGASNGLNGSIGRKLVFYLRAFDEVMVIYEASEMDDWIVLRNSLIPEPGERFEAMDHGGVYWKLSTRHLVTTDRAVSAAIEFIGADGVISDLTDWETFPDDFI